MKRTALAIYLLLCAASAQAEPIGANPTASVGLTPVNGSAPTFMRSDAAPALSQSIAPMWTGIHTWSLAEPRLKLNETGVASNQGNWDLDVDASKFRMRTRTDADGTGATFFTVTRTGSSVNDLTIAAGTGYGDTLQLNGQTFDIAAQNLAGISTGDVGATIYMDSSGSMYLASVDGLDLYGPVKVRNQLVSSGQTFSAGGCLHSSRVGGQQAGQFTSGTTGTCTVVITLPIAPNGWACSASNISTGVSIPQTARSTTSCTISGATTSGNTIVFHAMGY